MSVFQAWIEIYTVLHTFVGTSLLADPKILGYELPKGRRSWAGSSFRAVRSPMTWFRRSDMAQGPDMFRRGICGFMPAGKGHLNTCTVPMEEVGEKAGFTSTFFREVTGRLHIMVRV